MKKLAVISCAVMALEMAVTNFAVSAPNQAQKKPESKQKAEEALAPNAEIRANKSGQKNKLGAALGCPTNCTKGYHTSCNTFTDFSGNSSYTTHCCMADYGPGLGWCDGRDPACTDSITPDGC